MFPRGEPMPGYYRPETTDGTMPPDVTKRTFATGATRDTEGGKLDYEGFFDPKVKRGFARFMHKHRLMKDGSFRDSDNWQKGMPREVYVSSLLRHVEDVHLHHRGYPEETVETMEDSLYAIIFNAQGLLREIHLGRDLKESE